MRAIFILLFLAIVGNIQLLQVDAQDCLPTRLAIGDEARVTSGASNRIRTEPSTSYE